jgi:hypothetical protein
MINDMKYYDYKKVKSFIEKHKNIIDSVSLGMHEDWFWTAQTVYEKGVYKHDMPNDAMQREEIFIQKRKEGLSMFLEGLTLNPEFDELTKHRIGGILGSSWATPVIHVVYFDGDEEYIECSIGDHSIDDVTIRIEKEMSVTENLGCLSKPLQDNISPITRKI